MTKGACSPAQVVDNACHLNPCLLESLNKWRASGLCPDSVPRCRQCWGTG